jgi:hypothetical protein
MGCHYHGTEMKKVSITNAQKAAIANSLRVINASRKSITALVDEFNDILSNRAPDLERVRDEIDDALNDANDAGALLMRMLQAAEDADEDAKVSEDTREARREARCALEDTETIFEEATEPVVDFDIVYDIEEPDWDNLDLDAAVLVAAIKGDDDDNDGEE